MVRNSSKLSRLFLAGLAVAVTADVGAAASMRIAGPQQKNGGSGVPCIALFLPTVSGVPGPSEDVGNGVRDMFATFLTAPAFKTIRLDARLPALAAAEAREKQCPNILTATLTGKQSGGSKLGKLAGQAAGGAAIYAPGASSIAGSAVRGAVVGTGWAVTSLSSQTRVKDSLKLEYKVQTVDNVVRVGPGVQEAKAQVNGEDILTPVVQRAATQIADALMKAR
jgi:hypothetical protein